MLLNNRGSYEHTCGVTLTPFRHFAIDCLWRVSVFHNKEMYKNKEEESTDHKWEESVAVIADTPSEAARKGMQTYLRNKKRDKRTTGKEKGNE